MNDMSLPTIETARLPATYENAKKSLAECVQVDECQTWADKAAALASYARQAGDDSMRKLAERIQARAIRREGELFRQIAPAKGGRPPETRGPASPSLSRIGAAREAGISPDQMKTAIRVANIPAALSGPELVDRLQERVRASRGRS
jgi:hypothetical protein